MPTTDYFIQRNPIIVSGSRPENVWEEVDEFVFKNWKFAVDENDKPRYNGNRFSVQDGKVCIIQESGLSGRDLIHIAKLSGANHNDLQSQIPGGFCRKPEYVKIVKGNGTAIRQVGSKTFRAQVAQSTEAKPKLLQLPVGTTE